MISKEQNSSLIIHHSSLKVWAILVTFAPRMLELLITGFYLGAIHIFSAPDHLAAIIPLSLLDKKQSWKIGLLWGIGHLIGLSLLGVLLYYFKSLINLEFLEHYSMLYIALLLVLIGVWIVYKSNKTRFNQHSQRHSHLTKLTLGTGILHGGAAVSHIYSLAPTISMNDTDFFAYFGGFSLGSILAVVLLTLILSIIPNRFFTNQKFYQKILLGSGILTILVGIVFIVLFFSGVHLHSH